MINQLCSLRYILGIKARFSGQVNGGSCGISKNTLGKIFETKPQPKATCIHRVESTMNHLHITLFDDESAYRYSTTALLLLQDEPITEMSRDNSWLWLAVPHIYIALHILLDPKLG
jgi:hypothetical protein